MVSKRFTLRAACYFLLIKKGKVLLLRRFNTGWEDGKYILISGHLEGNETVKQAMIREAGEEAGITINSKDLHIVHAIHRKSNNNLEYIDFFLLAKKWKGEPKISEPKKCDDMKWFPLNNLPENLLTYVKKAIENYQNGVSFSEFGW